MTRRFSGSFMVRCIVRARGMTSWLCSRCAHTPSIRVRFIVRISRAWSSMVRLIVQNSMDRGPDGSCLHHFRAGDFGMGSAGQVVHGM